ncbi:hypothetical protein G9A89_008460 [Geosiphon pyriformis]|nr:hypothetical protein G9A89_008460 [Geosiphon pyriformis]
MLQNPNFKRREIIFQHDNQRKLLLISSGGGFEKPRKVPLPKRLVKEYRTLRHFKQMAHMANEVYCIREKDDIIGKNFIGPEMSKSQMENTKFKLGKLHPEANIFKIDSNWWKSWPEDCFAFLNGRIEKAMKIIKTGREGNKLINVLLIGHGIGGFYAQLTGLFVTKLPGFNENVYITVITFGSPRSGDSQYAARFHRIPNLKVHRITHTNDYFPHFPKKSTDGKLYMHPGTEYWISDMNCDCEDPDASRLVREGYGIVYQCPGFSQQDKQKYGENPGCNLGTDGKGTRAHFGPYFGVTFGNCENYYPIGRDFSI